MLRYLQLKWPCEVVWPTNEHFEWGLINFRDSWWCVREISILVYEKRTTDPFLFIKVWRLKIGVTSHLDHFQSNYLILYWWMNTKSNSWHSFCSRIESDEAQPNLLIWESGQKAWAALIFTEYRVMPEKIEHPKMTCYELDRCEGRYLKWLTFFWILKRHQILSPFCNTDLDESDWTHIGWLQDDPGSIGFRFAYHFDRWRNRYDHEPIDTTLRSLVASVFDGF